MQSLFYRSRLSLNFVKVLSDDKKTFLTPSNSLVAKNLATKFIHKIIDTRALTYALFQVHRPLFLYKTEPYHIQRNEAISLHNNVY